MGGDDWEVRREREMKEKWVEKWEMRRRRRRRRRRRGRGGRREQEWGGWGEGRQEREKWRRSEHDERVRREGA